VTEPTAPWPQRQLKELIDEVKGSTTPVEGTSYVHYSVPSFADGQPTAEDGGAIKSSKRPVAQGDILICKINPRINRVWSVSDHPDQQTIASTEWIAVRPKAEADLDPKFLLWYLRSPQFRDLITSEVSGVTGSHTRAKPKNVLGYPVPVPPLTEQQVTVEVVERLLSRLDAAVRTLASVEARKAALRQAVILHETDADRHAPMGEIAATSSGGTPKSSEARLYDGDVPWINSGELADQPVITTARNISQAGLESSSAKWVEPDTLLIAMYGASIGRLGINKVRLTTNQAVAAVVPDPAVMDVRFLFYRLMGDRRKLVAAGKGGAQNNISQGILRAWKVPVPSLEDQRSAVQRIERALSFADAAGTEASRALTRTNHLRRSILKAAFESRLTDPTQIESSLTTIEEAVA
jgi:type I restriction enzyme, S subunit